MHKKFDSGEIEKKWQEIWAQTSIYNTGERDSTKEKEYVLVEWPYPSGNLHIGHWYAFAVPDIYVRLMRMQGKQVLYPMGFDAFGLPAENAAIKRNLNPKNWTDENIAYMQQLSSMGNAFSWDKTTNSTDLEYYKWTQWMFTQFFENDIAYRGEGVVNWCPGCNTVIANEQVAADDTCERCGNKIEKKVMPQWMLRITKYADRLIDDLENLDWPSHIKEAQRQWIGRSEGAEIDFTLSVGETVAVFTTRPDTLYGATYLVLAPEHALLKKYQSKILNWYEVETYQKTSQQKAEKDRLDNTKEKTGVKLEGITATNPGSGEEIPVYIADYVLASYGTGAIMAVPAHDERDNAFARKFGINVVDVVAPYVILTGDGAPRTDENIFSFKASTVITKHWSEDKYYVVSFSNGSYGFIGGSREENETAEKTALRELTEESGYFDIKSIHYICSQYSRGYKARKNREEICADTYYYAELNGNGRKSIVDLETKNGDWWSVKEILSNNKFTNHHLEVLKLFLDKKIFTESGKLINSGEFDGIDSETAKKAITEKVGGRMTNTYRLRDWSIGRQRYWGVPIPIVYDPQGKAHVVPKEHLPWTLPEDVDFKPTGVAPLAKSEELKLRTEKIFGAGWKPEVETMDTFVDSSWYYLRYLDNENEGGLASLEKQKEWMPIDIYFGGAEHTTMHLLYSRFWHKALFDLGLVSEIEPYKRRINRGLILGPDGNKMSKSKGNVIDPDEQVKLVGADTVKMYLAFMGPYEGANYPFDLGGIAGLRRFLERVYGLVDHIKENPGNSTTRLLHKTIKKVADDIEGFKFNTAISAMMIFINQAEKEGITNDDYLTFLKILAPFAPHLTEELWQQSGKKDSIHLESFPTADVSLLKDEEITIGVQINGKMRGTITISPTASEAEAMAVLPAIITERIPGGIPKKVIYVKGRILNLIVAGE
ncbi:MAG TPA: class I tRNA ligase family protein [Candidatus Paceibacterota bacterium]|nr:class I tRNA ligase family protein [Candidatus Paceibacterota bacterium]